VANLNYTGTGAQTRISPDKTVSGGRIPADPVAAGLPAGQRLSPDPSTAATQTITVVNP
jgi:hypothetical protein